MGGQYDSLWANARAQCSETMKVSEKDDMRFKRDQPLTTARMIYAIYFWKVERAHKIQWKWFKVRHSREVEATINIAFSKNKGIQEQEIFNRMSKWISGI